ncbi:MAG: sugar ABC transporter permease [Spirochaetia bacterium]|jgi:ABC-type sugar transport system permease subunit
MKIRKTFIRYPLFFIAPAFVIYLVFFVVPNLTGLYYSVTDLSTYSDQVKFIGLSNFARLIREGFLVTAIQNTFIYAICVTVFVNVFGIALALLLNEAPRLGNLYRTAFFTPYVIAPLIVGYLFTAIYQPEVGILNKALRGLGLGFLASDWLNDPRIALFSIIMTELWRSSGFAMVVYLAGLKTIPRDLLDQASVDGATYLKKFRRVTFPLLAPSFTVTVLLMLINSLKVFETVLVLTNGGPGWVTEVFNTFIYRNFAKGNWGYATSASLALSLVIAFVAVLFLRLLRRREVEM